MEDDDDYYDVDHDGDELAFVPMSDADRLRRREEMERQREELLDKIADFDILIQQAKRDEEHDRKAESEPDDE